jgi:Protein kinase domain/PEGA domain
VLHQIGAGTLGPVFRAYDSTRERLVAVKLVKLDLPPERTHQLVAEFEHLIAADLTHPALAAPLATGISGASAFLAQDYVAADSLDLAVREYGPAPPGNVLRVATQLAGALDYAAAVHVTHGALHPRDLLLSSDDTRLTGIGVAQALERLGVVAPVRRPYTAPERIAGAEWDRRADVFSLAALMHELMWGKRVSGVGTRAAERLGDIAGTDPRALRDVFARALAENPAERFETALAFAEALKNACPDVAVESEPAAPAKRRTVRNKAPRLPLDETSESAAADDSIDATLPPGTAVVPAGAILDDLRPSPSDADEDLPLAAANDFPLAETTHDRHVDPAPDRDVPSSRFPEPGISHHPAVDMPIEPAFSQPTTSGPAGFITGHGSEPLSALERTRSAVWPLVLALGVGIAIGFAAGFFSGSRQEAAPAVAVAPAAAKPDADVPKAAAETEKADASSPAPAAEAKKPDAAAEKSEPAPPKPDTVNAKASASPKTDAGDQKSPATAVEGRLLVRTRPAGAHVSVDGKDYGPSPATVRNLARGTHHLKITHEGYVMEERRVVVSSSRPSQSMTLELAPVRAAASSRSQPPAAAEGRFVGSLAVDSRPTGAKVFMDGTLVGTTPMALPSVPVGSHAIRLEHDGYRHWSSSVRVVASEQNRVTASLER